MISVDEALGHVFALAQPVGTETVPLRQAAGRVLAKPVVASRAHPPFATSTMDGYAIATESVRIHDTFQVIGEAAAGHRFDGDVAAGQAVRIFTGAPIPPGTMRVVIQEDTRHIGSRISISSDPNSSLYIRPDGADFKVGSMIAAPRLLSPSDVALIASMNQVEILVSRKPVVALIATGDELVMPGEAPGADQIIASNALGLAAMVEAAGGIARVLPIARDKVGSLQGVFDLAKGADLVVTIGGASVGDHDLVGQVAEMRGMERAFYKVAMRPGKPLMAGQLEGSAILGLPGNPVSSIICGRIFMLPMMAAMQGLPAKAPERMTAILGAAICRNGPREHYMRARRSGDRVVVADCQDSGLLSVLADANALVVRPPNDPAKTAGDVVDVLDL
ncbi:molybdopterin molybdotransferase MoeA [uncultured Boseongicola sp.]|uniref:molybdopterin molybdotransferase MoeA n=1 Tax=uncultured Boseongicola sp. TaxID=1648499 RepID=UPI002618E26A|nr:molybdopterin molybdotransferase MoeA [uncultured Boseongicola sp.]